MPSFEEIQTAQLAAATAFCDRLNKSDTQGIGELISDKEFQHEYRPDTLGEAAKSSRDKKQTLELFDFTFKKTVEYMGIGLPPKQVVQGKDSIVFLVVDNGKKPGGVPYVVEYVLFFTFEPDGDKIVAVREYQDSQYVNDSFKEWYQ